MSTIYTSTYGTSTHIITLILITNLCLQMKVFEPRCIIKPSSFPGMGLNVVELSYLSPSLCRSPGCGLHSWSKAGHSVCWHQLPWHRRLKGVNKHCVKSKWGKKQALVVLIMQRGTRHADTNDVWAVPAGALPGRITQGREGNVQAEPPCQKVGFSLTTAPLGAGGCDLRTAVGARITSEIQGAGLQTALTSAANVCTRQTKKETSQEKTHTKMTSTHSARSPSLQYILSNN